MTNLSQQNISDVTLAVGQEAPMCGFHKISLCTEDAGRVILGGASGGVKVYNTDKLRGYARQRGFALVT